MFVVTVPGFGKGEDLRVALEQFALALIRHDAGVRSDCGPSNIVSSTLRQAARKAKIHDSRFPPDPSLPRMPPELLIVEWGRIIEQDYKDRLKIACRKAEGELDSAIAPVHSSMANIESDIKVLINNQHTMMTENASLRAQVQILTNNSNAMEQKLYEANQHIAKMYQSQQRMKEAMQSPVMAPPVATAASMNGPVMAPPVATAASMNGPVPISDPNVTVAFDISQFSGANPPTNAIPAARKEQDGINEASSLIQDFAMEISHSDGNEIVSSPVIQTTAPHIDGKVKATIGVAPWNFDAEERATTKTSDKNTKLFSYLIKLRAMGCINTEHFSQCVLVDNTCVRNNKSLYKYCLQLVEFVAKSNDLVAQSIQQLGDRTIEDEETITNAANIIVQACEQKLLEFDPNKTIRKRTVVAFGGKIRDYKQKIARARKDLDSSGKYTAESVELIEKNDLDGLEKGGTPPGNMSIRRFQPGFDQIS